MCQMCEEYEAELIRMGLAEEARKVREHRHRAPADESARREDRHSVMPTRKADDRRQQ